MSETAPLVTYVGEAEANLDGARRTRWRPTVGGYLLPDAEMAAGSTLGGPKLCAVLKATGAIEKAYSIDAGAELLSAFTLQHWDERTGARLAKEPGTFGVYPECQEHRYTLGGGVAVREVVFVLNRAPQDDGRVDPPALYCTVELTNVSPETVQVGTYAFAELSPQTVSDVVAVYDEELHALVAWNQGTPEHARIVGCPEDPPTSYETTFDHGKAVATVCPGALANTVETTPGIPLGALHHSRTLASGASARWTYLLSVSADGADGVRRHYRAAPSADAALAGTHAHFHDVLRRSVVLTPNAQINRGVLWAKANMLRVELKPPTGWGFTNSPTQSNKAVARDTVWFALGADYITPEFARASLLQFVRRQEPSGLIVEDYDMLDGGQCQDYGLNINDNTPLLILGLWHHYQLSGDRGFLEEVYPAALKAARCIASQRNDQGLVWCTSTATGTRGIIGWRNVIQGYRLSGATTELNAECYAAFRTIAQMAHAREDAATAREFEALAAELKDAVDTHLVNPSNGLYYLNIEVDGTPRSDVTSDLVFPVIFGVAPDETAVRVLRRLDDPAFWTAAGMRTTPRDAPNYSPAHASGLMGGVWVGVSFWFAYSAARWLPNLYESALELGFANYARDPRRSNTVPGQFSEWLHGETLHNQGMMLSPWFPPRYLWAALEGAAGLDLSAAEAPRLVPQLPPSWEWIGVQNLQYRGDSVSWVVVRMHGTLRMYGTHDFASSEAVTEYTRCETDVSDQVLTSTGEAVALGFRDGDRLLVFVGNTDARTVTTAVRVGARATTDGAASYHARIFDPSLNRWVDRPSPLSPAEVEGGTVLTVAARSYALLELRPTS